MTVAAAIGRLDTARTALVDAATGTTVTVADVLRHADRATAALRAAGAGTDDAVVVAMPPGLPQALVLLALLAAGAPVVPVDVRSPLGELAFVIDDSAATTLVAHAGADPALVELALARGLAVVQLDDHPADPVWALRRRGAIASAPVFGGGGLLLHTSGTTSTPKLVGLRSEQLASSAATVAATLGLGGDDRGLLVMPLFHIHGIVAGLLAPVLSGGCVVVSTAFDPFSVERRAREHGATWMTAVPSAHRAVLRVARDRTAAHTGFRALRSSSSPLDPALASALAERFGCPVLNSYGMTEATHQMASQQLGDGVAPGVDVGLSDGSRVALLLDGEVVEQPPPDVEGEVLVRGPHVIDHYLAPAGVDAGAFVDGWLRTGDLGVMCGPRLRLVGRSKEMINVAGEKVSPFEVEAALRTCPGVLDLAAFAVPDTARGERVGLVVAADGSFDVTALRRLAREQLAAHKVPAGVVVVDAIPLGPTGKVQRSRLAALLGLLDTPHE